MTVDQLVGLESKRVAKSRMRRGRCDAYAIVCVEYHDARLRPIDPGNKLLRSELAAVMGPRQRLELDALRIGHGVVIEHKLPVLWATHPHLLRIPHVGRVCCARHALHFRRVLRTVRNGQYGPRPMRLVVARREVLYTGRLTARLPEAVRLLMFKADGSFLVHDDAGGYRPQSCIQTDFRSATA